MPLLVGRICALAICAIMPMSLAQPQAQVRSVPDLAEVIDLSLDAVAPFWERHSTYRVASLELRLGYARTLSSFGLVDGAGNRSALSLRRAAAAGDDTLLADCDQYGAGKCERLRHRLYVVVEQSSISASELGVMVHMSWVTKTSVRSYLSSASVEVFLRRSPKGPWTVARVGTAQVS